MKTLRMTDRWVRTISVKSGREEFCDSVTPGLRLRVSAKSHKWCVMTRRGGKQVRVQIGEFPEVPLGEARRRARHVLEVKTQDGAEGVATPDDEIFPSLQTLCEDYVEQMKAKAQGSHDAYHRILVRGDHSLCRFMEKELKRPARVVDVAQEHAADWLRKSIRTSCLYGTDPPPLFYNEGRAAAEDLRVNRDRHVVIEKRAMRR
ncbi:MAG: Arm DNA-binding domain-containing protein [Pseudomonadota bacterium]